MKIDKICVLGGTGFVGRHLISRLANQGYKIKVLTRNPQKYRDLYVLPSIIIAKVNVHDVKTLIEHFTGYDVIINLIGILYETTNQSFQHLHVELVSNILEACRSVGIKHILHMSALNASTTSPSNYLRTKANGEQLLLSEDSIRVTCFRPSVIFAPDDNFYNRFAHIVKIFPVLLLACPHAKFAPVYVGDVVRVFEIILENKYMGSKIYELCGPRVYSLREIVESIIRMLKLKVLVINLSDRLSLLQARILGKFGIFTIDHYLSLKFSNSTCKCNILNQLGIEPLPVESIMTAYFAQQSTQKKRYNKLRQSAGRP